MQIVLCLQLLGLFTFIFRSRNEKLFCLFLTEEAWSHGGLRARELGQTPLVLDMKSNVSTSPDLYIEFSTEY